MSNIFLRNVKHNVFAWERLGNIREGRGDLGEDMPVLIYRLMLYTMLDVLGKEHGGEMANEYFRRAGFLTGMAFAKNTLDLKTGFSAFFANLQQTMQAMKISVLRIESFNSATGDIALIMGQDVSCSGLPVADGTVCYYDEGFIAGILEAYTGKKYAVREVDCWASGGRVCRFNGAVVQ